MSRLTCSFCAHRNPDGSKFCNQCGSPLHLVACSACDAINNQTDTQCCRCGAPLAVETETVAPPPVMEAPSAQSQVPTASVPIALADRMDEWAQAASSGAAAEHRFTTPVEAEAPDEAASNTAAEEREVGSAPTGYRPVRLGYDASAGRRLRAAVLGVACLAIAGALYWSSGGPMPSFDAHPSATVPQASAPAPVATPTAVATPAPAPAPVAATPEPAAATATPAPDPMKPSAGSAPAAADAASTAPVPTAAQASTESPPAPAQPAAQQADASGAGTPAKTSARVRSDAHRRSSVQRTRSQAERDALATQRLIARDLADIPRTR